MKNENNDNPILAPIDYLSADDIDMINSSSATDCTGLIPSAVQSDEELESYREIYDFLSPIE